MAADATFDSILVPHNATPTDLERCFVATGVPTTVAAAGSTAADATPITSRFNLVTAADGTKGVLLLADSVGVSRIVHNSSASALKVWPPTGAAINTGSVDAANSVAAGLTAIFITYSATQIVRVG